MSANPHRFHAGWSGCWLLALAVAFAAGCQKAQSPVAGGREVEPETAPPSQPEPAASPAGTATAVQKTATAGEPAQEGGKSMKLTITSSAFADQGTMPRRYTGDGDDVSPPLAWSGIPEGTQSLALICDDPDAPVGTWVHWVIWNIPAGETGLAEGIPPEERELSNSAVQGTNDFRKTGYGGPAPPRGPVHRYFFKLYALDTTLDLAPGSKKAALEKAMQGHIRAQAQLVGRYSR